MNGVALPDEQLKLIETSYGFVGAQVKKQVRVDPYDRPGKVLRKTLTNPELRLLSGNHQISVTNKDELVYLRDLINQLISESEKHPRESVEDVSSEFQKRSFGNA